MFLSKFNSAPFVFRITFYHCHRSDKICLFLYAKDHLPIDENFSIREKNFFQRFLLYVIRSFYFHATKHGQRELLSRLVAVILLY